MVKNKEVKTMKRKVFKVILSSSLTDTTETIEVEGDLFTTDIDLEDLNAWIREFAQDNGVPESSVSYEVTA